MVKTVFPSFFFREEWYFGLLPGAQFTFSKKSNFCGSKAVKNRCPSFKTHEDRERDFHVSVSQSLSISGYRRSFSSSLAYTPAPRLGLTALLSLRLWEKVTFVGSSTCWLLFRGEHSIWIWSWSYSWWNGNKIPHMQHGKKMALSISLLTRGCGADSEPGILRKRRSLGAKMMAQMWNFFPMPTWHEVHCHKTIKYQFNVSAFSVGNLSPWFLWWWRCVYCLRSWKIPLCSGWLFSGWKW